MNQWEVVIGIETHVQLQTSSKIFSGSSTAFGAEPNVQANAVDIALPGVLPVLNKGAVECAIRFGLAVEGEVAPKSVFARKNYFYPDLPKGYQISQFELPVVVGGKLAIQLGEGEKLIEKTINLTRAHLEEDAGKSLHEDFHGKSGIDLNRAGTPLLEIVSEPDMRSAAEAVAYLKALYSIVTYLGVCDGNMEEGSFRCDANVSLRPVGTEPFGTRTELKNLNSFRNVQRAIEYEIARQQDVLDDGDKVVQETRLYDAVKNTTASMRSKEDAHDYRYFPDPDILPIDITDEEMSRWRAEMPELPQQRVARFVEMASLPEAEAEVLLQSRGLADFFETAAAKADPKKVANFVLGPLLRECNTRGLSAADPAAWAMKPEALAELVRLVDGGTISAKIANDIFGDIFEMGVMPEAYVKEKGLVQISDTSALEAAVDEVIAANPAEVEAYRGGKTKLISFFVGQIMRATKGKANPALVNELLAKKL